MTTPPISGYREVANIIRDRIADETYPRGGQLPTEVELAESLGVHRVTVNRALNLLRAEGLVRVHRGKGTYVSEIPVITRDANSRYTQAARESGNNRGAFAAELTRLGYQPRNVVTVERVQPPVDVADILGLDADTVSAVRRHRLMYGDDHPLQVAVTYIPLDIAEGTPLEQQDSGTGGIISRYAELGHAQTRVTEDVSVRPPTEAEAAFLKMTTEQRVYDIVHIGWTADDRPVEHTRHVIATHQYRLHYEFPLLP